MGALADFVDRRFGVKTRAAVNPLVADGIIGAGVTQVLRNNPDRFMFTIINLDAAVVMLAPTSAPAVRQGIWLDANGGFATLDAETDGELVGQAFWVWSLAGNVLPSVYVIETEAE